MIIGFAGKAASGKTTAARHLLSLPDLNIEILPMARMLREEIEQFLAASGAPEAIPLVYGDQEDKLRVFYLDPAKALEHCPQWDDFLAVNRDIQDRPDRSAVTVRRILQWWGTEFRRAQDPDYWTTAWERKLAEFDLQRTHILVDDVRFPNEVKVIKKNGGFFVRIERPGFDGANDHSSENSLDSYAAWDRVILNDGPLDTFLARVEDVLRPLLTFS